MDVHQALNWRAIWPVLASLPANDPITLLDAGCGAGVWCRCIARRRPAWRITGLDRDATQIAAARAASRGVPNLAFVHGDFSSGIVGRFDAIISIASIHYAASEGRGVQVLTVLREALAPSGRLIMLLPRREDEQPAWGGLPRPQGWPVFGVRELEKMIAGAGLSLVELRGLFGSWCMLGKQVSMWAGGSAIRRVIGAPVLGLVRAFPAGLFCGPGARSYALRALARAR